MPVTDLGQRPSESWKSREKRVMYEAMTQTQSAKAILLYDGACRFCTAGVARWRNHSTVEVIPVQGGAGIPFGLDPGKPMGAIHLVDGKGELHRGAAAVFRMMDLCGDFGGGTLWRLYRGSERFRALSDRGYAWVAARRARLSGFCATGRCPAEDS
jgi:predicted DCC family thiol-disulfide oxidoreductase YuxK